MPQLSKKQKYIVSELWILAWNASVQRARPYNDTVKHAGTPDKRIADFKTAIIGFVTDKLLPHYLDLEKPCCEEQHYKNIARLIEFANQKDPGVLGEPDDALADMLRADGCGRQAVSSSLSIGPTKMYALMIAPPQHF